MGLQPLESGNAVLQTIHASEGNRALKLLQERQKRLQGLEAAKTEIENETKKRRFHHIDEKYTGSTSEALEEEFRKETVGLVTAEEFKEKRKRLLEKIEAEALSATTLLKPSETVYRPKVKTQRSKLSFGNEDTDEDDTNQSDGFSSSGICTPNSNELLATRKTIFKDPTVDTSFLSDAEREARLIQEKEKIIEEYKTTQERIKQELLEVTYSYWDGLGHRRMIQINKGSTISQFLTECRRSLEKDFPELRAVSTDNLMYIKEDLILPHQITFYELIRNKARGKSGPLFNFDVHDDVRLYTDTRIEKDESHAGKIVDRKWYERNKHIFPASRWEMYDPSRTYEKYTIHGDADLSEYC